MLWARSRIATLGDYQKIAPDSATQREITELGLKYRLLTDYTSFIAVDKIVRNPGGAQAGVDQPQPLPAGRQRARARRSAQHARARVRLDDAAGRRARVVAAPPPHGRTRCAVN